MKRILIGLTILGLLLCTAPAYAASGTTQVSVTVGPDASITVPATCTLTTAGAFANYLGFCGSSFSVRTTKVGGDGSITLSTAADWAAGAGGTGPTLAGDVFNFGIASGILFGTVNAGPTRIAATATPYNVITAMGANRHASGQAFTTNFSLANNPSWETDTYTINIVYTLSSS
jgi:hypothetical protein